MEVRNRFKGLDLIDRVSDELWNESDGHHQKNLQTTNAGEAEVEQFYEDLQDLLELTPQKDVLFIIGD